MLEAFVGASEFDNGGQRVVVGQRLMQAVSDIFLGWVRVDRASTGRPRDFYLRQLRDWKGSAEIETMVPRGDAAPTASCAGGPSPGRTPGPGTGSRSRPTSAAARPSTSPSSEFAEAYADQNERDHRSLVDAIASGRITAEAGGS